MIVKALELDYFRNYVHLETEFDPRVNLIYGDNAQGKTNLLEAIAYLSTARSHRARYDREMMMMGVDSAFIQGDVLSRDREFRIEAKLFKGKGRQLYANGLRLKSAGELGEMFQTVLFCPEDLYLIREGGAARRKFLDSAICQIRPRYAQALAEYNRLHEHKTRILRDWPENPSLLDTLDDFNLRMAQTGAILIHYRAHFIKRLQEHAPAIHADFSGNREQLSLNYETVSTVTEPLAHPKDILTQLLEHQQSHRHGIEYDQQRLGFENNQHAAQRIGLAPQCQQRGTAGEQHCGQQCQQQRQLKFWKTFQKFQNRKSFLFDLQNTLPLYSFLQEKQG